jgi:hypothetical protein
MQVQMQIKAGGKYINYNQLLVRDRVPRNP